MKLNVIETYTDAAETINSSQNGELTYEMFNRFSKRSELLLIDWLSGDVSGIIPPFPYTTQKNKDWLSPLITKFKGQVVDGEITRPDDYYQFDSMRRLVGQDMGDCEDEDVDNIEEPNKKITLLDGQQFDERVDSYIEELRPTINNAIAKQVGLTFEFAPKDVGSIRIDYIRYPSYGFIVAKTDPVFNNEIPDSALSQNYEWEEGVKGIMVWFIVNLYADSIREQALKQTNMQTGKTPKG